MAEDKRSKAPVPPVETVEVPASLLQQLQARLDHLESIQRVQQESLLRPTRILDQAWEQEKEELAKPAAVRTQEAADRKYGTAQPRWTVHLDGTTEDGKPGPNVSEHFPLTISAHGELEAQAFYLDLMGIRKHDYRVVATPLAS